MKITYLNATYKSEYKIPKEFTGKLSKLSKKGTIAIYSSIQFLHLIDKVKKQLEEQGYKTIITKPDRANFKGQILGCDSYMENLKLDLKTIDVFIYIGDGMFHPNALLLAQENEESIKPVLIIDPIEGKTKTIQKKDIEKYLKKKKANLAKFYMSDVIGVFISSKWGQQYKDSALKLKKMYKEKQFYYFLGDNFQEQEMDNFPYVECWINTACPRIGQDDILRHTKPVVNIKDIWK